MWKWYFKFRVYLAFIPSLSLSVTHTLTPDRLEEDSRVNWVFLEGGGQNILLASQLASQYDYLPHVCLIHYKYLKFKKVQLHCLSLSRFHTQL